MLVNWIPYMPAMRCSTRPLFLWRCTNNYLAPEVSSCQEILKQVIVNGRAKVTSKMLKIITIVTCSWFPSNFAQIQGCLTSRKMLKIRWDLMVIIQHGHWDAIFFNPWSSLHDIENRAGSHSSAAKDWVLTPAQSSSPMQPSTPKTPTRFHASNMSMHAIGSPNAQSHVYPPSYSKELQTPQNHDIGDVFISNPTSTPGSPNPEHSPSFWNSLHEHPSAQDVQSTAISAERPVSSVAAVTVEPDEVNFEQMDDSNTGNLHQLHSNNSVSSVDLTETVSLYRA